MGLAKWIAAVTAASVALADPIPQDSDSSSGTDSSAATAAIDPSSGDIAAGFLASLIANVTQVVDAQATSKRDLTCSQNSDLIVNALYAQYQGSYNATTGLNVWKGNLRWQPPVLPNPVPNPPVTPATTFGAICPQVYPAVPGIPYIPGDEDCLFLSVYAPSNAQNLPVLVYIHGGGYGYGDGTQDMSEIINSNNNTFIAVTIQYRLGAFGFLSSQEVKSRGVVNAGILDQAFALAWVKTFICQFGGNPNSVTISGESAGAGSVMYHDLAIDGLLGDLLFNQSIAASPYLPFQYTYNAAWPTQRYYNLSEQAGCGSSGSVFDCLVSKNTTTLLEASYTVTQMQTYGYWAFYPVTDNVYIMNLPSQQLKAKQVNGNSLLIGQNANEGPLFVPPTIANQSDLIGWLQLEFPNLSMTQINSILAENPNSANTNSAGPFQETDGLNPPDAVNVSQTANGQQQRADNIYAEATFVCPSYWMASAFTNLASWHYQYSVPFAWHTTDIAAYFGPPTPNQGADFVLAFRRIWGNFITTGNPSISNAIANGASSSNPNAPNGASNWPVWADSSLKQLNLNETGGTPYQYTTSWGSVVTQFMQPGLQNAIAVVPADTWEGGRGTRCEFYQNLAPSIPA